MYEGKELVVAVVELRGNYYQFGLEKSKELLSTSLQEQMALDLKKGK